MNTIDNLLDTLQRAHCDNAQQAYYAKRHREQQHSTMPATSFIYEFFLFNSLYQYDWETSFGKGGLVPWPADEKMSESAQQNRLEKFVKEKCKANHSILKRAFDPITQLEDLDGRWTQITPDSRITIEQGKSFFDKLSKLRGLVICEDELTPSRSLFDLISGCRYYIYLVRNNIFHGSKPIDEIFERDQRRRLEVYDIFLKSLVSLFFLAVGRTPVAADHVQIPIRIPFADGSVLIVGQSEVVDSVVSGLMKPEDSRLIRFFVQQHSVSPDSPSSRAALFYPSSGRDLLTPILLGLPYCTQFHFYDVAQRNTAQVVCRHLRRLLGVPIKETPNGAEDVFSFTFAGVPRFVHVVRRENRDFYKRDVDLAFYFHRGDSWGEGGSGQEWDRLHIVKLGEKTPRGSLCRMLTDGEPGGLHPDLRTQMQTASIPISHRGRDYYFGVASGEFIKAMEKTEHGLQPTRLPKRQPRG